MNTLAYGLLSLLSHSSLSGYDLMLKIQPFWPAKHSQIYPLLARLEQKELVSCALVQQSDKPDKKVYSIKEAGLAALREWLTEPASDPVMRDELMLKAFCMSNVSPAVSRKLFVARLEHYRNKMTRLQDRLQSIRQHDGLEEGALPVYSSPYFGAFILLNKGMMTCRTNIEWCEWVLQIVPEE
ncbi:PadR family transcriptional regulator [Cohnella boryungensis]|jgi:DNA-binding PadR family transcriptional regulator|uniref:PadR family transcriptional regulator n=1 Tax=Cohnella boryungensis TaxID=768479 RepID=A0ABV8S5A9_9BACL